MTVNQKFFIITFGCQMNESDSERFSAILQNAGYQKTHSIENADIVVINSCSVRKRAEDRVHGLAEKLKDAKTVILTGCMSGGQADIQKLKESLPWVDIIISTPEFSTVPDILRNEKINPLEEYFEIQPYYGSKFQAYVPISTGCNNFCSYCIVPYSRGREKSRSRESILKECENLIKNGYKEIMLLGQNVNSYGNDLNNNYHFADLLSDIDKIEGDYWIRFISSHPKDVSEEIIRVMVSSKHIAPQMHFALQSGSDRILNAMNRHYTAKEYLEKVEMIRSIIPNIAITTDIIVGFPGETQEDFQETEKVMEQAKFSVAYLNEYSPRKGTVSFKLKDDVNSKEKHKRKELLNEILAKTAKEFNSQFIGNNEKVLWKECKKGMTIGINKHGISVSIDEEKPELIGNFKDALIKDVYSWGMKGQLI